jgi:hypothetical protein
MSFITQVNAFGVIRIGHAGGNTFQAMNTAATENAARAAHKVSAGCGFSVISKPPMKEIPTVRVITQPATAAALTTQPLTTTQSFWLLKTQIPQPTCNSVKAIKIFANVACSVCIPIAVP